MVCPLVSREDLFESVLGDYLKKYERVSLGVLLLDTFGIPGIKALGMSVSVALRTLLRR